MKSCRKEKLWKRICPLLLSAGMAVLPAAGSLSYASVPYFPSAGEGAAIGEETPAVIRQDQERAKELSAGTEGRETGSVIIIQEESGKEEMQEAADRQEESGKEEMQEAADQQEEGAGETERETEEGTGETEGKTEEESGKETGEKTEEEKEERPEETVEEAPEAEQEGPEAATVLPYTGKTATPTNMSPEGAAQEEQEPGSGLLSRAGILRSPLKLMAPGAGLLGAPLDLSAGGPYFPRLSFSASYNGSNIIVSFDIKLGLGTNNANVYAGWSGELFYANLRGMGSAEAKSSSSFGTITYTNVTLFNHTGLDVTGYITITDPAGLISWYNSGNHAFWYNNYQNSGGSDLTYVCSSANPMSVPGLPEAYTLSVCRHNYVWEPLDGTTHRQYCTVCGTEAARGTHNTDIQDTSSLPGYVISKCSLCGYAVSTAPASYIVTLDNTGVDRPGTISVSAVYMEAMPALTPPGWTGKTFRGYFSGEGGTGTQYYNENGHSTHVYDIAGPAMLYPLWELSCETVLTERKVNDFRMEAS